MIISLQQKRYQKLQQQFLHLLKQLNSHNLKQIFWQKNSTKQPSQFSQQLQQQCLNLDSGFKNFIL